MKRTRPLRLATVMSLAFLSMTGVPAYGVTAGFIPTADTADALSSDRVTSLHSQLLERSGLQLQLLSLPDAVAAGFDRMANGQGAWPPFSEADLPSMRQILVQAFDGRRLASTVTQRLERALDAGQVNHLLDYYASVEGQQLRDAELEQSLIHHGDAFALWSIEHGFESLPISRQLVISDLERALKASRAAVDTVINMQVALQAAVTPALPPGQRLGLAELLDQARSARPQLETHYRQHTLDSMAFIYRELPDGALIDYAHLLRSEAGTGFVDAVNQGLNKAMLDAAEALGVGLQPLLQRRLGREV